MHPPSAATRVNPSRATVVELTGRFRDGSGRSQLELWVLLRLLVLALFAIKPAPLSDVDYYASSLKSLLHGGSLASTMPEYPLPMLAVTAPQYLLGGLNHYSFAILFAATMLVVDAGFARHLWRGGGHQRNAALSFWLWWLPTLGSLVYLRFDLVPAVLVGGAVLAAARADANRAGAWCALGTALKLWPAVLLPVFLLRPGERAAALRGFVVTGVAITAVCWSVGGWSRLTSPLTFQRERGLQIESIPATPLMLVRAVHDQPWQVHVSRWNTTELFGPTVKSMLTLTNFGMLVAMLLLAGLWLRAYRVGGADGVTIGWLVLTTVLVVTVANKTLSPQYLLWLSGPLAALLLLAPLDRSVRKATKLLFTIGILTQLEYPILYHHLTQITGATVPTTLLLAVRNGLIIWLTFLAVRQCWQRSCSCTQNQKGPLQPGSKRAGLNQKGLTETGVIEKAQRSREH